jgi:predicted RNA-binding Zn-ribbon protein involved in translation (DUF1610 family)
MIRCPECAAVSDNAVQCSNCGASLMQESTGTPIECGHCGERIASDADACPACGELREARQCSTHGERAASGQCVVCGSAVCDGCNRGGANHYLCETHCDVAVVGGWAQIYSTSDDLEAQLIRENLEAEGLDARVLSQKDHFSLPVDLGDLSPVRVLVPAFAYEEAERLLDEHRDLRGGVAFGDGEEEPPTA